MMEKFTPSKVNTYLFFKIPSAYICGVRVMDISVNKCVVKVRHSWINQNPFKSIYFAVQAMAAELSTGALVMSHIDYNEKKISMLVANSRANFSKKATGTITFVCNDGGLIDGAIQETIATGDGQNFWMTSIGTNEKGEIVSTMEFEWSIRLR